MVACLVVALGSWAVSFAQECWMPRLVAQGLTQLWGQEAGEMVWSVGTTSGERAGEECL